MSKKIRLLKICQVLKVFQRSGIAGGLSLTKGLVIAVCLGLLDVQNDIGPFDNLQASKASHYLESPLALHDQACEPQKTFEMFTVPLHNQICKSANSNAAKVSMERTHIQSNRSSFGVSFRTIKIENLTELHTEQNFL